MTNPYRDMCAELVEQVQRAISNHGLCLDASDALMHRARALLDQPVAIECQRIRTARRPKPPSLKEQALSELNLTADPDGAELSRTQVELIRQALEALPND